LLSSAVRGSYPVLIVAEDLSVLAKKMSFYVKRKKAPIAIPQVIYFETTALCCANW
jgi:hypothetical protein